MDTNEKEIKKNRLWGLWTTVNDFESAIEAAKKMGKGNFDAIIALGCIIRGETPHFDFIANSCASGLIKVSLEINKPVIFGVLTTNSYEQALERADPKKGNKGLEAALSAMLFIDNLSLAK